MQLLFIRHWLRQFGFASVKMFDKVLNIFFCSHSIPFWDKCKFVGSTTKRLFAHYLDMARDLILNVTLSGLIAGRAFIFQWVSNQFILHLTCKVHHIM